jgi:hypothetical protein
MTVFFLDTSVSFALNPQFELDLKALRAKNGQGKPGQGGGVVEPRSDVKNTVKTKGTPSGANKEHRVSQSSRTGAEAPANSGSPSSSAGKMLRKSATASSAKTHRHGKRHKTTYIASKEGMAVVNGGTAFHTLRMSSASSEMKDNVQLARHIWDRLIAPGGVQDPPLQVEGKNFSLSLDPDRYPVLPASDGGKIILDVEKTLPPLVKAIILEKEPGVRIVSENPSDCRRFFNSLFAAARFYSIEEGFSVSFGSDPKVTVTSDYKIEKNADSLSNSDVYLVNVTGRNIGLPLSLLSFLEKEGFHFLDSSPVPSTPPSEVRRTLYSITDGNREKIADALLGALSVSFEKDRNIALDDGAKSGVSISVRADRYYEGNGKRVVFSFSEANPVQYTLLKLLEIKGYKVVMLYPEDDFRKIIQKILSSFKVPASYGNHHLWNPHEAPFDVQLSGFILGSEGRKGGTVLLTNVAIDSLFRELVGLKGYEVIEK